MSTTYRGRRIRFDNIAVGSATGAERTISGGGGETVTQYGGRPENYRSPCGSSYTSVREIEHFLKTVTGGVTTDQTNA